MSEDYWDGGTFVYQAQITNGAGGGGSINFELSPGPGSELELLGFQLTNGDTSARAAQCFVRDDDNNTIFELEEIAALGAADFIGWPTTGDAVGDNVPASPRRCIISGGMNIIWGVNGVAAGQDASLGLLVRVRGAVPTMSETGNSTPTITINKEQVF